MAKRRVYTDEFRASACLMLEAAGYPDKKGSLTRVANHLGIHAMTLSRWFKGQQNPPPNRLVSSKKRDMLSEIQSLQYLLLGQMVKTYEEATFRELATGYGILTDKHQLLSGNATERTEVIDSPREQLIDRINSLSAKGPARIIDHVDDGPASVSPTA